MKSKNTFLQTKNFISNQPLNNQINISIKKELNNGYCLYEYLSEFLDQKAIGSFNELTWEALKHAVREGNELNAKEALMILTLENPGTTYQSLLVNAVVQGISLLIFDALISHPYFNLIDTHYRVFAAVISSNRLDMIKLLLQKPINFPLDMKSYLLRIAATNQYIGIMNCMLADPHFNSLDFRRAAISLCAASNKTNALATLLDDPQITIDDWNVALSRAAINGHLNLVIELLKKDGIDPSIKNNNTLTEAVRHNHIAVINELLKDPRVTPFNSVKGESSAFALSASLDHQELFIKFLKDSRITDQDHQEAFFSAVSIGQLELVNLLLKEGKVKPNAENNNALCLATYSGFTEIVKLLLAYPEVDPSAQDNLFINSAASRGFADIVRLLLKDPRVDPNARIKSNKNQTPVREAATKAHLNVLEILVEEAKVDLNLYPELIAEVCQSGCNDKIKELELIKFLIKDGRVYPRYKDDLAIEGAARWNKFEELDYILSVFKFDSPQNNSKALCSAIKAGHFEITALLLKTCVISVEEVLTTIPELVEKCVSKQGERNFNLLKLLISDPRIICTKSLNEWDIWLKSCPFKNENWIDELNKLILKALSKELWNKIKPFSFFKSPSENGYGIEIPIEVRNAIYSKML